MKKLVAFSILIIFLISLNFVSAEVCEQIGKETKIGEVRYYCSLNKVLVEKKADVSNCDNGFECLSGDCNSGECIDFYQEINKNERIGLFKKIFCWIINPLDEREREKCIYGEEVKEYYGEFFGQPAKVTSDGNLYSYNEMSKEWTFSRKIWSSMDRDYSYDKWYVENQNGIFLKHPNGTLLKTTKEFSDSFEGVGKIQDLISLDRWNKFAVVSPDHHIIVDEAGNVLEDFEYTTCLLNEECEFTDNKIEVSSNLFKQGSQSLKFYSLAPEGKMITAKSHIFKYGLLHFVKGDDVWFSGEYYLEEGKPFTIVDLQDIWVDYAPGMRLAISDIDTLGFELGKWIEYKMYLGGQTKFPRNQWVNIKFHLYLSDEEDGIIEVWVNDEKAIDAKGKTLPMHNSIYNFFEVGITATQQETTLYVDDIRISSEEL